MKRPWYIKLFCLSGWIWLFVLFPSVFSPETKKIHLLLPSIYGIIIAFLFIATIGIWHLKKWGLEMFFIALFLKNFLDNIVANFSNEGNFKISFSAGFLFFFIYALILTFVSYNKMQNEL
jgi:phosphatidylserine synthase